jgi:serine/threonine protein kinase
VLGVLGRGGMGAVYLAQDDELDRTVAIKVLHPWVTPEDGGGSRLIEEARRAAKLEHPSIVPIYDVGRREDGSHFIVMQYVDGPSLQELIVNGGVSIRKAVAISEQVTDGLVHAHRQGLIHRDIKPANILTNRDGHALLADFGLAIDRANQRDDWESGSGTVPYMAPEQLQNDSSPIDRQTDVWAIGVVLYEMLTGRRPFAGSSSLETSQAILRDEPVPPRQLNRKVPLRLQRICLRCLAKRPENRFASAGDVGRAIRKCRTSKAVLGTVTLCVLACLLAFALTFRPDKPWVKPAGDTDNSPISPWLDDCQLVFTANTGARIQIETVMSILRGSPPIKWSVWSCPAPSRQGEYQLMTSDDKSRVRWEVPLVISAPTIANSAVAFARQGSLWLQVEISREGHFQLGIRGDRPEDLLSLLVLPGSLQNYRDFSAGILDRDLYDVPHDELIDSDAKQTALALQLKQIYTCLWVGQAISRGPSNSAELYSCPMSLRNRFSRPITMVEARIYHQQFDYSWFREEMRDLNEAANARWSPIARRPIQECNLSFGFNLECESEMPSAIFLRAQTDGERTVDRGPNEYNESAFVVYGLDYKLGELMRRQGENCSVTFDEEKGECRGQNYEVSSAQALLLNQHPTRIELTARSAYSSVWPSGHFATLGEVRIGACQSLPTGQSLRDIRPDVWVIPPEKTQREANTETR